jgi:hypothetical protein
VAFASNAKNLLGRRGDTNGKTDVFIRDRTLGGKNLLISVSSAGKQGNADSYLPELCGDGTSVAFVSLATNLVAADTNAESDVLVRLPWTA